MSLTLYAASEIVEGAMRAGKTLVDIIAARRAGIPEDVFERYLIEVKAVKEEHDNMNLMSPEARAEYARRMNPGGGTQ